MSSVILNPFQLLELNIISAQDLANVARSMRTYAIAWVHPDRKLSTRVDSQGKCNPTWNDKFVFRVDDEFLRSDTSGVMIEIYAVHWFRDVLVGSVRVLVGNLMNPSLRPFRPQHHVGMRFAALQVRRPSGRPQGIVNIGVAVLDSSMRSMPLYTQLSSSAVGYLDLMGEQNSNQHKKSKQKPSVHGGPAKPELRRSKSDSSSILQGAPTLKRKVSFRKKPSSVINPSTVGSSVIEKTRGSISKKSSVVSDSYIANARRQKGKNQRAKKDPSPAGKTGSVIGFSPSLKPSTRAKRTVAQKGATKNLELDFEGTAKPGKLYITESELGPSPSEMAAQMAKDKYRVNDGESSVVGGWSLTGSVEGLQSKLERWRMELPPVYDRGDSGMPSIGEANMTSKASGGRQNSRRHNGGGGGGLFSCVSNICGCECSIVCGKDAEP